MKLISLNSFGGTFFEPLRAFVTAHAPDTDIFCFQEILSATAPPLVSDGARTNLLQELIIALPDFQYFFAPTQTHFNLTQLVDQKMETGVATFMKKNLPLATTGSFFVYGIPNGLVGNNFVTLPYNTHHVTLSFEEKMLTVCNFHGTAEPGSKFDTPERLAQSQKVLNFLSGQSGAKIVCGDFNLLPHTQSVGMFEQNGFRNLIKEFKITSTRGSLLKKIHPEYGANKYGFQEFADYTFVTPDIQVTNFQVPDLPISDHLPMILEFDLLL